MRPRPKATTPLRCGHPPGHPRLDCVRCAEASGLKRIATAGRFNRGPCRHLGPPTGETRDCTTCGGAKSLPLLTCALHGVCTDERLLTGTAWCRTCADHEPPDGAFPGPVVRNLLYHVCPAAGSGVWRRNVAQLLRRMHLFNGRRVVAIVTGEARRLDYEARFALDPPAAVREAFAGHVHEFIEAPNVPQLREVVTFLPLLERAANTDPCQITFYGHAKGVTRPDDGGVTVHRWAEIMYQTCLDYPGLVEGQLARHPVTGSFKKNVRGFEGSASEWHYSGAFFWLRNSLVFSRPNWRGVDRQWWGSESWPGVHFGAGEAGCLFHAGAAEMDLFSMNYMVDTVEPAYSRWHRDNERWRGGP